MGTVEYVMRGQGGMSEKREFIFNTVEDLADQMNLVLDDLLNVDEMANTIIDDMPITDQMQMSMLTYAELVELHKNVGKDIRNVFGLWVENNPNIATHPDDTSMKVLAGVWARLISTVPMTPQIMDFS